MHISFSVLAPKWAEIMKNGHVKPISGSKSGDGDLGPTEQVLPDDGDRLHEFCTIFLEENTAFLDTLFTDEKLPPNI